MLALMRERLGHRGPDGSGTWRDEASGIGFAHTRLAVIDLSTAAAQPMISDCGRCVLVQNGEIYNYRELRSALEAEGDRFRSASDTEVLLNLLRRHGTAGLERVVGMFAFAFWDRESRELVLGRDRLGIKPLVYAPLADGGIAFASEIHALSAHPGIDLEIDRDALSEYLACLYVPAPRTIHRGIRKLPPGHLLRWRAGETAVEPYWRPRVAGTRRLGADAAVDELMPALRRAVADCMVADVPVGCFLSGGIDSSVVAALMAEHARGPGATPVTTFTMTFAEATYDERHAARRVARHVGSRHIELPANPRFADGLDTYVRAFGEPFGNPTALLVHELSRQAREHVTVALVGDGGDEVFAGYPRYRGALLARHYRRLPRWLRTGVIEPAARVIPESTSGHHGLRRAREFVTGASLDDGAMYASWVEYFAPDERARLLDLDVPPPSPIAALYDPPSPPPAPSPPSTPAPPPAIPWMPCRRPTWSRSCPATCLPMATP